MLSIATILTGIFPLQSPPKPEGADPLGLMQGQAILNPGKTFHIVLNGSSGDADRISAILAGVFGAGVQHMTFECDDIFRTVAGMRSAGASFLKIPDNY